MDPDTHLVILVIYTISMCSAIFALWIKWVQDDFIDKMREIIRRSEEIEKNLIRVEAQLEKAGIKDPFTSKNKK